MDNTRDNKILIPGDCKIESVILMSYNGFQLEITNLISEIVIHESMNNACLSGYLQIADNLNLIRNVPIIGNEKVIVSFVTPSRPDKVTKTFFCYKTDQKIESESNKGSVMYRLNFVSEEFINCTKKKISVSFREMRYSDMVYKIFTQNFNSSKKLMVQPTLYNRNLIIPYMSPLDAIDMIMMRSISDNNKDKSYIFYEDLDGFSYCALNYYAKKMQSNIEYTWFRPNISETRDPMVLKNIEKEFYRIESYEIQTMNNTINNIKNGMLSSIMLMHDSTFKTLETSNFSYNSNYLRLNTLTGIGSLPKNNDKFSQYNFSHYRMYPRQSYAFENTEANDDYDKVVLDRNAYFSQLENSRMSILVPGDSQRRIGEMIKVNIPSSQPGYGTEEEYDPYISGNYIVTEITHMISKVYYKMRMTLERDSMPLAYPEKKDVEINT